VTRFAETHDRTHHKESDPPNGITADRIKRIAPGLQNERNNRDENPDGETEKENLTADYHESKNSGQYDSKEESCQAAARTAFRNG
jgi:hypothetical protein